MNKLLPLVKRYRFFLIFLVVNLTLLIVRPELGVRSFQISRDNFLEMVSILPPIFILLGLLDVWVDRETMTRFMGPGSGIQGHLLAFLLGSAAAGPLYAAFPIAIVLLKKGATLTNVFLMIGAWSTTKIPMILFEISNLGFSFAMLRLAFNLVGIFLIATLLDRTMKNSEREKLYERAEKM